MFFLDFAISLDVMFVRMSPMGKLRRYLHNSSKYLYCYSELEDKYVDVFANSFLLSEANTL